MVENFLVPILKAKAGLMVAPPLPAATPSTTDRLFVQVHVGNAAIPLAHLQGSVRSLNGKAHQGEAVLHHNTVHQSLGNAQQVAEELCDFPHEEFIPTAQLHVDSLLALASNITVTTVSATAALSSIPAALGLLLAFHRRDMTVAAGIKMLAVEILQHRGKDFLRVTMPTKVGGQLGKD